MTGYARTLSVALALEMLLSPTALAFDWSGNSDVYVARRGGRSWMPSGGSYRVGEIEHYELGWGYHRLFDTGLFINGTLRQGLLDIDRVDVDPTVVRLKVPSFGYGLGLGYRAALGDIQAGWHTDTMSYESVGAGDDDALIDGPRRLTQAGDGFYAKAGVNLLRYSHFLLQAEVQMETLRAFVDSEAGTLPKRQYVASAGLSIHATDINSVIPVATAVTVAVIALCLKEKCNLSGWRLDGSGWGNSMGSSRRECDEGEDEDCDR